MSKHKLNSFLIDLIRTELSILKASTITPSCPRTFSFSLRRGKHRLCISLGYPQILGLLYLTLCVQLGLAWIYFDPGFRGNLPLHVVVGGDRVGSG